ncbi:unnamed protein product [Cunninghamella echinulata]
MKYLCVMTILFLINITQGFKHPKKCTPIFIESCVVGCTDHAGKTRYFPSKVIPVPSDDNCNKCSSTLYTYPDGSTCLGPKACTLMACP